VQSDYGAVLNNELFCNLLRAYLCEKIMKLINWHILTIAKLNLFQLLCFVTLLMFVNAPSIVFSASYKGKPPPTRRLLAEGEHQYMMRCSRCHGQYGDGNGQLADLLDPRPRDFTMGMFKFRTTASGALPTDEDLFQTITRGIPGTQMPSWGEMPEQLRWALVYYIKNFADDFKDPEQDPYKFIVELPPKVSPSPESIEKGARLYNKNKCGTCHGNKLRGDGRTNLKNDWDHPVRTPNLNYGWKFKGGYAAEDILYRFVTGMNGTAMPSYADSIKGKDQWHLANYIVSMVQPGFNQEKIFKAPLVKQLIPLDVDATIWQSLPPTKIAIQGQTTIEPLWINNAVDVVDVRAVYNENEIGLLLEWDDPVQDNEHHKNREVKQFKNSYVQPLGEIPREPGVFRDAIAVQFPVKAPMDRGISLFRGDQNNPVNFWVWKTDLASNKNISAEEHNAWGMQSEKLQPVTEQQVRSTAKWKDGRWHVVIIRPLKTADQYDVQFAKDRIVPISFNVWDGSNGEHELIMGMSSWHLLYLDDPESDMFDRMKSMLWFFGVSREFSFQ